MPFLRFQKSGILEGCPSDVYLSMDHVTKLVYEVGTGLIVDDLIRELEEQEKEKI